MVVCFRLREPVRACFSHNVPPFSLVPGGLLPFGADCGQGRLPRVFLAPLSVLHDKRPNNPLSPLQSQGEKHNTESDPCSATVFPWVHHCASSRSRYRVRRLSCSRLAGVFVPFYITKHTVAISRTSSKKRSDARRNLEAFYRVVRVAEPYAGRVRGAQGGPHRATYEWDTFEIRRCCRPNRRLENAFPAGVCVCVWKVQVGGQSIPKALA